MYPGQGSISDRPLSNEIRVSEQGDFDRMEERPSAELHVDQQCDEESGLQHSSDRKVALRACGVGTDTHSPRL